MAKRIASMSVGLTAHVGPFISNMRRAGDTTQKTSKRMSGYTRNVQMMAAAQKRFNSVARIAAGVIAGLAVRAIGRYVKSSMEALDATGKLAERLRVTSDEIMGLRFAADILGASAQDMDKSIQEMNARIGEAAGGTGEAKDALKALGIDLNSLLKMGAAEQFHTIARAITAVKSPALQGAYATDIFGRAGKKALLNMLQQAGAAEELGAEFLALHGSFSAVDYAQIAQANDDILKAKASVSGWVTEFTKFLAPAIAEVAKRIANLASSSEGRTNAIKTSIDTVIMSVHVLNTFLRDTGDIFKWLRAEGEGFGRFLADVLNPSGVLVHGLGKQLGEGSLFGGTESLDPGKIGTTTKDYWTDAIEDAKQYVAELRKAAEARGEVYAQELEKKMAQGGESESEEVEDRKAAALARVQSLYDSTRTAAERYADTIAELNQLLADGVMGEDLYARAVDQARKTYEDAKQSAAGTGIEQESEYYNTSADSANAYADALERVQDMQPGESAQHRSGTFAPGAGSIAGGGAMAAQGAGGAIHDSTPQERQALGARTDGNGNGNRVDWLQLDALRAIVGNTSRAVAVAG